MTQVPANSVRRQVMGDSYIDRAMQATDEFTQPLQDFINQHAWGSAWERDGLGRKERSLVTLGVRATLRATTQLRGHVRGAAVNNGCTPEETREALLHCAVYAGVLAASEAMRVCQGRAGRDGADLHAGKH